MSKIIKKINESDCVGDSLGKHNYNYMSLDQNICDLSSRFFTVPNNIYSTFKDLCANINNFNAFADYFEFPTKLNQATTAAKYMSSFWDRTELNFTFPINIYEDSTTKFYLDENTADDVFQNWGINRLKKFYPESNFLLGTISNISFFLYSNIGKKYTEDKNSNLLSSDVNPTITKFNIDGTYNVPSGVTTVDVLLVGGGGGGGGQYYRGGGGGGGGGGIKYIQNVPVTPYGTIAITIGAGGVGGSPSSNGSTGGTTTFGNNSVAGGKGGGSTSGKDQQGALGGITGAGNTFGYGGRGQGDYTTYREHTDASPGNNGENGYYFELTQEYFAGGGGGGSCSNTPTVGGKGGGGRGGHNLTVDNKTFSTIPPYFAENGIGGTGGGGGGAAKNQGNGATGGSGLVVVIQKQQTGAVQTTKIFNVNNSKDDIYIKSMKVGRFIIDPITKSWTFFKFV